MSKFTYLHPLLQADPSDPTCDIDKLKEALRPAHKALGSLPKSIVSPYEDEEYRVHGLLYLVYEPFTLAMRVVATITGFVVYAAKFDSEDFVVVTEPVDCTLENVSDVVSALRAKLVESPPWC